MSAANANQGTESTERPRAATITDREAIEWLEAERERRGDRTLAATATKIVLEHKARSEARQPQPTGK